MRRSCAVALAGLAALAIAPQVFRRDTSFAVTGSGIRASDEFAVPLLEAISQERAVGTTGVPLLSLVNVCPRWPFCHDAKVLVYTYHEGKVIFYWYRKDQPCSLEYHSSGPCENGETKGFEILARIIESQRSGLRVKNGRLMWEDKYVYAFSLQGLEIHKFAFTGRIYFQKASGSRSYFSQPVSVSRSSLLAMGPERPEDSIIPGAQQSAPRDAVPTYVCAMGFGFVVVVLATIRRRSRRHCMEDEMSPFICSSLSDASVVDLSDESQAEEPKEDAKPLRCQDNISKYDPYSRECNYFEKDDTVPMGSLESTCAPSSAASSLMSNSVFSFSPDGKEHEYGTYPPVFHQ
jgi:hypothetical protein